MISAGIKFAENYKTLLSSFMVGNTAGLILFLGSYPPLRRLIETAFPYGAAGYYTGTFVPMAGLACGFLIFPAVVALKTQRFYCFWGLMPITIVFLWLAIGFGTAHRLKDFIEPVWMFPSMFFLSWAVSSFPISLFRWVRRARKPAPQIIKGPGSNSRRYLLPSGIGIVFLFLIFIGWHNFRYPKPLHANIRITFGKGRDVIVPLIEKNGGIFVTASLNGQPQLCQIDTGSDTVNWVRDLQIAGKMTQERGQACDSLDNCVSAATVKLPKIQIGSYTMTGLPTEMLDSEGGLFSSAPVSPIDETPLLGNALFSLAVITIDYQRKTLTIRPPTYDFTKQANRPSDKFLQMGWTSHSEDSPERQQVFGWPVMKASAYNKPFWCMIDTGWEGPELGITQDFLQQLPVSLLDTQKRAVGHFAYGTGFVPQLNHLNFQVAALSPHTPPVVLSGRGWIVKSLSGVQGIVGTNLMQRFRITLDYPRRRVLLEPYAHKASEQKAGKTWPKRETKRI